MPVMTKMRDNMPAILIAVVVAFIVMVIFEWGMDFSGTRGEQRHFIGKVNDREISYQEFSETLRNFVEMQRQQFGGEINEQFMEFIRGQVWDNIVTEILLEEEIRRRGIEVTDDEIVNWVYGENPPDFLTQQFMDEEGVFDRVAYDMALSDPRNREQVMQLEQLLKRQRKQEKLQSILLSSVRVTEGEIKRRYLEENLDMDVRYVVFDPNELISGEEAEVTDDEIRRFYNANRDDFINPPQRSLEYVIFHLVPSRADTLDALQELEYIQGRLEEGEEFLDLVEEYSHTPFADAFFSPGELSPEKEKAVFGKEQGEIVGPVIDDDGVHLIKIIDTRRGAEEFVNARHILLRFSEDTDSAAVREQAQEILRELREGGDFAGLAREYSTDPGSAERGGDLGWFGRGRMVAPFERAAFSASIGDIVGPVESQFGLHIIQVLNKTDRSVKIATVHLPVEVSDFTRNEIFDRASDFAYVANRGSFKDEADYFGVEVQETGLFSSGVIVPGVGRNEAVMRFAFDRRRGNISDVLEARGGYGVFRITETRREEVKPLSEVESQIRSELMLKKRKEKALSRVREIRDELGDRPLTDITQIDPSVRVRTQENVGLNSNIAGVGRDQIFIGAALAQDTGIISQPVEGERRIYLVEVTRRSEFDQQHYADRREVLRDRLLQTKRQEFFANWLAGLREEANIVDNRHMFFR